MGILEKSMSGIYIACINCDYHIEISNMISAISIIKFIFSARPKR